MIIIKMILILLQQLFFSLSFFSTIFQFLKNEYNQIQSLNVQMLSIFYLLLSIIFIDNIYLGFLRFHVHDLIIIILFLSIYIELSYLSKHEIIKRLYEAIIKIILSTVTGISLILQSNFIFDKIYLGVISLIMVIIVLYFTFKSKNIIYEILKNGLLILFTYLIFQAHKLTLLLSIIFFQYSVIYIVYYYISLCSNKLN